MKPVEPLLDEVTVTDVATLKIIADPQRLQLLELLQTPLTVKMLAAQLGVAATRLYYHLNLLQAHGLVDVVDVRIDQGAVEKLYRSRARKFRVVNPLLIGADLPESAADALLGPLIDETRRKLSAALQAGLRDDRRPPRFPFVTAKQLRLTDTQLTVLHKRLEALIQEVTTLAQLNEGGTAPRYDLALIFTRDPDEGGEGAS
jgi:DNA-binding transcriptional ArsR family regulator